MPLFSHHPAEKWIPVRYLQHDVECDFCRFPVMAKTPGRTKGSRGTVVWWNPHRRVYECMECRSEGMRAEAVRDEEELRSLAGARP